MYLGSLLEQLRFWKGSTQQHVADAIGVSKQNYGNYELGKRLPPLDRLTKICDYFKISLIEFFCMYENEDITNYDMLRCALRYMDNVNDVKQYISNNETHLDKVDEEMPLGLRLALTSLKKNSAEFGSLYKSQMKEISSQIDSIYKDVSNKGN